MDNASMKETGLLAAFAATCVASGPKVWQLGCTTAKHFPVTPLPDNSVPQQKKQACAPPLGRKACSFMRPGLQAGATAQ
jgi:hypothetical protein